MTTCTVSPKGVPNMVKVFVKWGKERYELDACTDVSPLQLKSQLFSLTGVNPNRQKVLVKGKVLGDTNWNGIALKDGMLLMMIGSEGDVPAPPSKNAEALSDSSDINAQALKQLQLPRGLTNLGNTCYMNATLQCLMVIPELKEILKSYADPTQDIRSRLQSGADGTTSLTAALSTFAEKLETKKTTPYLPICELQLLHNVVPQFAARDEHGLIQQDANECWMEFLRVLKARLHFKKEKLPQNDENTSFISRYMEGKFRVEMKNLESADEPVTVTTENFMQLSCFLSQEVKYVQLGIKNKMTEEIVKNSPVLNRDAKYEKRALIDRLPGYLSIQMVRFYYKEKDKVNAKILKDVKFPLSLDLFDMCTPELQQKLLPAREAFKDDEEKKLEALRKSKTGDPSVSTVMNEKDAFKMMPYCFDEDPGSNNSGFYELMGVITHKGRSSNSGHYVAWVRVKDDNWAMCDDDQVQVVHSEDILRLSGGGDWHCAYLLLYGPRILRECQT